MDLNIDGIEDVFNHYYRFTEALHQDEGCGKLCRPKDMNDMMKFRQSLKGGANITAINEYMKTLANTMYRRFKREH